MVRYRTVAKVLSIGLVVRKYFQCSAGSSRRGTILRLPAADAGVRLFITRVELGRHLGKPGCVAARSGQRRDKNQLHGNDRAGTDGVDANAAPNQLARERAGKRNEPGFGRRVDAEARHADSGVISGDENDRGGIGQARQQR